MPALSKPKACEGCSLYNLGNGFSRPEGSGVNGVLLAGEALGYHEMESGLPFRQYAPAGHALESAIRSVGMSREQFAIWNVCACQPPSNELLGAPYEMAAIDHCKVHFRAVMERYRPRVIVALGNIPTRTLTGLTGGKHMNVEMLQGFPIPSPDYPGVWVIPCYHPSYIARGAWEVLPILRKILVQAVRIAKNGYNFPQVAYNEKATTYEMDRVTEELTANPDLRLSLDIETKADDVNPNVLEDGLADEIAAESDPDILDVADDADMPELDAVAPVEPEAADEFTPKKKSTKSETMWDCITQINFSINKNEAFAATYTGTYDFCESLQRMLATPNEKYGHNFWMYDLQVFQKNRYWINGPIFDTMWAFNCLYKDLPGSKKKAGGQKEEGSLANLQFCAGFYGYPWPWKHEFSNRPGYYGCCDADAGLYVRDGIEYELRKMDVWQHYIEAYQELFPIIDRMGKRGIPVNWRKLQQFTQTVRGKARVVLIDIQQHIPEELRPVKQKEGLKRAPKSTDGMVLREFKLDQPEKCGCVKKKTTKTRCISCGGLGRLMMGAVGDCIACAGTGKIKTVTETADPECAECNGAGRISGVVRRWAKLEIFKPTSPKQLKAYAEYKLHKIPKNSKKKIAMDKETLTRMAKRYKDPVYKQTIEYREYVKMASAYGDGWMPRDIRLLTVDELPDEWQEAYRVGEHGEPFQACAYPPIGYVHAQFNFAPASGQLSAVRPNVLTKPNPSKYGVLATMFADCIEAPPGYSFREYDWKSFHAQTFAWASKDWAMLRLAKIDMHSYVAAFILKLPDREKALSWDDHKLAAWLKVIKKEHEKVRNAQAKPCILGYNLGRGAHSIYTSNEENFPKGVSEAQAVMDVLEAAFERGAHYRASIPEIAKRQRYLRSLYGQIRWFWNVMTWDFKDKKWVHGQDWEKSIAFECQSLAFCHKKEVQRKLAANGWDEKYGLCNDVHDSMVFLCADRLGDECDQNVMGLMQAPSRMLMPDGSGLCFEVDKKVGKTWGGSY